MTPTTHRFAGLLTRLVLLLGVAACSSQQALVTDRLDEVTGVTVTHATKPLVLYRDRSARAAFARDFVYMGPIEVNNMGQRRYFLWLGIWGTADGIAQTSRISDFESVVVYADGEPLTLEVAGFAPASIGVSEPVYLKPVASTTDAYYRVTMDQLRLIAEARDVELQAGGNAALRYWIWDPAADFSAGLVAFLRRVE